jgi:hypothetical protein
MAALTYGGILIALPSIRMTIFSIHQLIPKNNDLDILMLAMMQLKVYDKE